MRRPDYTSWDTNDLMNGAKETLTEWMVGLNAYIDELEDTIEGLREDIEEKEAELESLRDL